MARPKKADNLPLWAPKGEIAADLCSEALALIAQGRLHDASKTLEAVLRRSRDDIGALRHLAFIRVQEGRFDDAAKLCRRALYRQPNSAAAHSNFAFVLRLQGRFEDAVAHGEKAVRLDPSSVEAHNNLGIALEALGRPDEAASHYEAALAVKPDFAYAHNNLGNVLLAQGWDADAMARFQKAAALDPHFVDAHRNVARSLARARRLDEAVAASAKAVALRPNDAKQRVQHGALFELMGRPREALPHYEKAVALAPRDTEARRQLAMALQALGRVDDALAEFSAALVLVPDDFELHRARYVTLNSWGRTEEAIAAARAGIAACPRKPLLYLALIEAMHGPVDAPARAALESLAKEEATLPVEDRMYLHFALGRTYGDAGQREQSFEHLLHGNALKRQQIEYDHRKTRDLFERVRKTFTADLFHRRLDQGHPSNVPIFVIGMPRSGTTLVEHILASHPAVHGAGELGDLPELVASREINGAFPEVVPKLSAADLEDLGAAYLQRLLTHAPDADRIIDKNPLNFIRAGVIRLILPNAKIIHTRRAPLDTCLSIFSLLFGGSHMEFCYDLKELGAFYRCYEALMEHWRAVFPESFMLEVQYEELVANPEPEFRRIIEFCGLGWDDACLAFHETKRQVKTASASQVRQPIYRSAVGRSQDYAPLLAPLVEALSHPD